jgi:hypothetical protein
MKRVWPQIIVAIAGGVLSACVATTTLSTTQIGATVDITSSTQSSIPRTESFHTTSFGNYEFRAQLPDGEPFYGYLPLKFNGGYLALDILFFTPATFFNLREVYPLYQFDLEKRVVKYKYTEREEWNTYVPLEAEVASARQIFQAKESASAGK